MLITRSSIYDIERDNPRGNRQPTNLQVIQVGKYVINSLKIWS